MCCVQYCIDVYKEANIGRTWVVHCASTIEGPFAVIGDVHGHMGPFEDLIGILKNEVSNFNDLWLVFVGDLVDRGSNPRKAI